jgi:fructose-1,6-bisphosphatase I
VQHYDKDTYNGYIIQQTHELPATEVGQLNWLLAGIVLACKIIGQEVRRIGLSENRNATEQTNVFGEQQMGLDVFANQVLTDCLGTRGNVALIASEEHERPIVCWWRTQTTVVTSSYSIRSTAPAILTST